MLLLTLASTLTSPFKNRRTQDDSYRSFIPTIIVPEERLPIYPDPDDNDDYEVDIALRELLNLNQSSLQGYQELLKLTTDSGLRNFVEIMIRQRSVQCGELAEVLARFAPDSINIDRADAALVDPNSADLRVLWLRAVWSYEQDQFGPFSEKIELAESRLEDAYLTAAEAVQHADIAELFLKHAMNVCGARQRLEELTYALA
ncbi:MAG: hypothetical protein JWM11_1068 [Planctomycetaceae bacterium]|nr:hypothetical protein [Planctomycetaceae bacterium]